MEHLASMEHQEHLAKTASTDYLASQDLRVNLAHPVSLCHRTNPDLPAPLVPLVKMELLASLVVLDRLVPLALLVQLVPLADQVEMVSLEDPDLKVKLELLVLQEALVEMDNLVPRADNLDQLDFQALLDNPVPQEALAKMVSQVDQELQAKMDSQVDPVSQVLEFPYINIQC
jgi:hypothetical protein